MPSTYTFSLKGSDIRQIAAGPAPKSITNSLTKTHGASALHKIAVRVLSSALRKGDIGPAHYMLNQIPEYQREPVAKWLTQFGVECSQSAGQSGRWIVVSASTPPNKKALDRVMSESGNTDLKLPRPPPQPENFATKRQTPFIPLDTRRLATMGAIDGRTSLVTSGNAPDMGKPIESAREQAEKKNTGPQSFVDQFTAAGAPERREGKTNAFVRSADVRQAVLSRANGVCECCRQIGFQTDSGAAYLETHHVLPLAEGGPDEIWNVVAICPNDHRRAHFAKDRADLKERFFAHLAAIYPGAPNTVA